MVETELKNLISQVETRKSEEQVVEVKPTHEGCPEKFYDTISAFANQNSGGTLLFGLDEHQAFARVGDADKRMTEYEVYSCEAFRKKTATTSAPWRD